MPVPAVLTGSLRHCVPLVPMAVVSIVWLNEAMWFQSYQYSVAAGVFAFCALVGLAVLVLSHLALRRLRRPVWVVAAAVALAVFATLFAQVAIRTLVAWGFSNDLRAYTSLVSLVASKQGFMFVLAVGAIPVLAGASVLLARRATS